MHTDTDTDIPLSLIHDGLCFMRSLTEVYGTDEGIKIWNEMELVLPPTLRGKMFLVMLSGDIGDCINLSVGTAEINRNVAPVIRCIRQYTGAGLSDAKDIWDKIKLNTVKVNCDPLTSLDFSRELRMLGCMVT